MATSPAGLVPVSAAAAQQCNRSTTDRIDTPFSMPTLAIPRKDILIDDAEPFDLAALPEAEAIARNTGGDGFHLPEPLHTRQTRL